jgi:hypothetical protein
MGATIIFAMSFITSLAGGTWQCRSRGEDMFISVAI